MKTNIIVKSIAIVIAFIVLVSLLGGWSAIFSVAGEFIKFIIFMAVVILIGIGVVSTWRKFVKR